MHWSTSRWLLRSALTSWVLLVTVHEAWRWHPRIEAHLLVVRRVTVWPDIHFGLTERLRSKWLDFTTVVLFLYWLSFLLRRVLFLSRLVLIGILILYFFTFWSILLLLVLSFLSLLSFLVWALVGIKVQVMRCWHLALISVLKLCHESSMLLIWRELSKRWWRKSHLEVDWKLDWIRSMRTVNHATRYSLLGLEVALLFRALWKFGHQLEVHEATLCISMCLGCHQGHGLLVVIEVWVFSVLWALLNGCLVSKQALVALNILVLMPLLPIVIRVARDMVVWMLLWLKLRITNNWTKRGGSVSDVLSHSSLHGVLREFLVAKVFWNYHLLVLLIRSRWHHHSGPLRCLRLVTLWHLKWFIVLVSSGAINFFILALKWSNHLIWRMNVSI